jgi:hypothetical protein
MSDPVRIRPGKIRQAFALGEAELVEEARYQAWLLLPNAADGGPTPDPDRVFALVHALAHRLEAVSTEAAGLRAAQKASSDAARVALESAIRIMKQAS